MNLRSLKYRFANFLASRGYLVVPCVDSRMVLNLVERMHPVMTDKDLIRIGGAADGGYLVPDDLDGIVACFSPGVSVTATFEQDLIARGIPCYLADASVESPPFTHPLIHFEKKFLGAVDNDTFITLDKWVNKYAPPDGDLALQMDIERAEFPVLLNASDETLKRFRVIVLELHSMENLLADVGWFAINATLDRILGMFHVVHLHPTNNAPPLRIQGLSIPRTLEATFLRRDRAQPVGFATQFPHPLDRGNLPGIADQTLPSEWHQHGTSP